MIVADMRDAYGKNRQGHPGPQPLMVLATLPRVLGPEGNTEAASDIILNGKEHKNVKVEIKVSGPV